MDVHVEGVQLERDRGFRLSVPELHLASGTTTALFGPNGAGKTTLLRLIGGLETPTSGAVRLGDEPALKVAPGNVAYAFQEAVFLSGTVRHNLALALELRAVRGDDAQRRIEEATEATGTTPLLDADTRWLSGGEGQRVNLARTLSLRSPLTLLDEPLAQLDGALRLRLLDDLPDLLRRFTETTVLVTHDLAEASRLAGRLVVLIGGKVRAHEAAADLLRRPPDAEVAELLGFVLVRSEQGVLAIHPERLRVGDGPVRVAMTVRRVMDLGHTREVVGTIGEARVAVALPGGYEEPRAGETLAIAADEAVSF
ncbi:MAG: ABC transporter ATP-binding protein [Candidatus Binatia bacterium]|nr:ABC transporter ATP-binding protein [Candidatus Binatia bacterium]